MLALCGCLFFVSIAGLGIWQRYQAGRAASSLPADPTAALPTTATPDIAAPTLVSSLSALTLTRQLPVAIDQRLWSPEAVADLEQLWQLNPPPRDYYEVARRLGSRPVGERTIEASPYTIGERRFFNVEGRGTLVVLLGITPHLYFWVAEGLDWTSADVQPVAERVETDLLPLLHSLFGQEWRPGVDGDPHITILHLAGNPDRPELGFFDSINQYPRTVLPTSNEQEMVVINMFDLALGDDLYLGTVAHEIQHLIHWHHDPNETIWLDEGLAQLAELAAGLDTAETADYLAAPETPLIGWDTRDPAVYAHYAAAYLFAAYLWEQLGNAFITDLAHHPANGLAAVRSLLAVYQPNTTLEQLLADWRVANWLDDPTLDPRYGYATLSLNTPHVEARPRQMPYELQTSLAPYGVHYIALPSQDQVRLTFAGDSVVDLPPQRSPSGERVWFVPPGDEMNAHLTRAFDLTTLTQAHLTFQAWYDLEEDYDFAYVLLSDDDGQTWELLSPRHAHAGEFGPALTGQSAAEADQVQGWVSEQIPLHAYAGRPVWVRFEVLTDGLESGGGLALDAIAIPELEERAATETAWEAHGFVHTGLQLPQTWSLQLIVAGVTPTVQALPLAERNQGLWDIILQGAPATLVISPLTPWPAQPADYWLRVEPLTP